MHDTAASFGATFFRCYADAIAAPRILEIGASDVNGTLRGWAPRGARYTGVDLASGPGVDVVLDDPYSYPFAAASFDAVVSSSCLEHVPMFWLSFIEMCRVARPGGFIYLNVPSNGPFHRYPSDNWRFYPDAGLALASWGRRNGHDIRLVESLIGRRRHDVWNDCVMIFAKGEAPRPPRLLSEVFPRSFNIRIGEEGEIANYTEPTEDMRLRVWPTGKPDGPSNPQEDDKPTALAPPILAAADRHHDELAAKLTRAEEMTAEYAAKSAAADAALMAAQNEIALLREERDRAAHTVAQFADIADAAQSTIVMLQARLIQSEEETAERLGLAASEREAICAERDRLAQERDEIRAERDRLMAESAEWFDAAILAPAEWMTREHPRRGWRFGRYRVQISPVRGRGSPVQRADRARDARQWGRAARFYLDALEQRPPNRSAIWVQLGRALEEAGRIAEAEFAYRQATQIAGRHTDALLQLSRLLRHQGRNAEAAAAYRRTLDLVASAELRAFLSSELAELSRGEEIS